MFDGRRFLHNQRCCSCPFHGNVDLQCFAMSSLLHIHTSGKLATYSKNLSSAAARPGRPTNRQCNPIDIILGDGAIGSFPSAYSTSNAFFRYVKNPSGDVNPGGFRVNPGRDLQLRISYHLHPKCME